MAEFYYTDDARQPAGPIPLEELTAMHERGELAEGALVAEVGSDSWQEAAAFFAATSSSPQPGGPAPLPPPTQPQGEIGNSEAFPPIAGWAFGLGIASWVCGGFLTAIPGVICGHIALRSIKRDGNTNGTARVLALVGLIAAYAAIAVTVVIGLIYAIIIIAALASGSTP